MSTIYDGETCMLCRNLHGKITPATHKVAEEPDIGFYGHPPSAYVCEDCFSLIMFPQRYMAPTTSNKIKLNSDYTTVKKISK